MPSRDGIYVSQSHKSLLIGALFLCTYEGLLDVLLFTHKGAFEY
jgi:hypothetical protein